MKRKMLLPLLAVVFAIVGAFASSPLVQQSAWFNSISGPAEFGEITVPVDTNVQPCTTGGTYQCMISGLKAYDTEAHANNFPSSVGLLKYN